jgi:histone H3/H4
MDKSHFHTKGALKLNNKRRISNKSKEKLNKSTVQRIKKKCTALVMEENIIRLSARVILLSIFP